MEIGFSSYAVGWAVSPAARGLSPSLDAAGVLRRAASLGYRRAQFADNTPLHELTPQAWAALRADAAHLDVALEIGTRGLTEENVVRYAALATEAGAAFCRIVIDLPGYEPGHPEIVALLRRVRPVLDAAKVVLAIENHDRFTAAELADIVSAAESRWIGICLDTANSLGAAEDLETVSAALAPQTVNVHLKDFTVRRLSHLFGFVIEGTPLGEGRLEEHRLKAMLARMPRCQSVTLEHWVPPAENLAATLTRESAWCDRSTATIRRWWPGVLREPAT